MHDSVGGLAHVHPVPLIDVAVNPDGSVSVTVMVPLVAAVPVFFAVSVNVTEPPDEKLEPVWVFVTVTSGAVEVIESVPQSFEVTDWPPPVAQALLVKEPVVLEPIVATTLIGCDELLPLLMTVLLVQTRVARVHDQPVPLIDVAVRPEGSVSVTVIVPVDGPPPTLLTVSENVTESPG